MTDVNMEAPTRLLTRSGLEIEVRPVNRNDAPGLSAFFDSVSHEDLRFRFFSSLAHVPENQIEAMVNADHNKVEDFVVTLAGKDDVVANAMLAGDDAMEIAEVAISISADMKGRGIGWTLLEFVTHEAKQRGYKKLRSIEARDNHQVIELEREMGFTAHGVDEDPSLVMLEADLTQ